MTMSRSTAAHSMTKMCETAVNPSGDPSRCKKLPSPCTLMSMPAWPSMEPATPRSAWTLASSIRRWRSTSRKANAMRMIISGPPMNSARVNCHAISNARMIPSSITRFVEAISKAIAAVKLAPLRTSDRAKATAA